VIVKRTRVLQPSPGMEPTRGQSQETQERPHWHERTGPIDRSQDPDFSASVGQTLVRQPESRGVKQSEGEPKECRELLHASSEYQDFLLELGCLEVRHIQVDHDRRCRAKPSTRRRARDAEIRGDGDIPGALDEIPKPVVVPLLMASRARHADDHRPSPSAAQMSLRMSARRPPTFDDLPT